MARRMKLHTYLIGNRIQGREFAHAIGVSASTISKLRRGISWPTRAVAHKIRLATQRQVSWDLEIDAMDERKQS